jgi:hypothetical protein
MEIIDVWMYGLFAIIGIIVMFFLYMEKKYNIRVIVKDVVKNTVLIKHYKAGVWVDKDKVSYWKLAGEKNKERKLLDLPPEECIELNQKGKKCAECYRFESGEIVWIRDDFKASRTIPIFDVMPVDVQEKYNLETDPSKQKEIKDNWKKLELAKWSKENRVIAPYQPVTTNQRMSYFNNIKKAEARKGFDWKDKVVPIVAISGLVMMVLGLMVFWGEIAKPALQADEIAASMQKTNLQMMETNKEMLQILRDIKLNQQTISTTKVIQPTKE